MDRVALPWMLPAGDYVLGWRWDTEESNQVWGQCADVTIKANAGAASLGSWEGVPCPLKRGPSKPNCVLVSAAPALNAIG